MCSVSLLQFHALFVSLAVVVVDLPIDIFRSVLGEGVCWIQRHKFPNLSSEILMLSYSLTIYLLSALFQWIWTKFLLETADTQTWTLLLSFSNWSKLNNMKCLSICGQSIGSMGYLSSFLTAHYILYILEESWRRDWLNNHERKRKKPTLHLSFNIMYLKDGEV